jgi:hypothetical protein
MFCPSCSRPNPANAGTCVKCGQDTSYFRQRVFIGRQFVFVKADEQHPVALKVDDVLQTCQTPTIISRHRHAVSFGDEPLTGGQGDQGRSLLPRRRRASDKGNVWPLPDHPQLPPPSLNLVTVVSDRKIYQPDTRASLFVVAPDAAESEAALEIQLAGHKVFEAKVPLNRDGLALHTYADLKEGEYTAVVTLPDQTRAECTFSVAEYTLSPLITTLEDHEYAQRRLSFTLRLLLLTAPYSGPVEFGLQCRVCGEQVVATQTVKAKDGLAQGEFDISGHGGPFHVQVTTPDGNTALVAFPGTGAVERERISINSLGQTAEMGLLPWENAQPVRGFFLGPAEVNMTPLVLESVHAFSGRLQVTADVSQVQIVTFSPGYGQSSRLIERSLLKRGANIEFDVQAPYTLFTVGAFTQDKSFEGWGIVIKPVPFEATLTTPQAAQPGQEIEIFLNVDSSFSPGKGPGERETPVPAFCWLLAYDVRLEHESPVPRLAKRIYESIRDASGNLDVGTVPNALDQRWMPPEDIVLRDATLGLGVSRGPLRRMRAVALAAPAVVSAGEPVEALLSVADTAVETPLMIVTPTRMEFPELVYNELFYMEGQASRTVKLGDQIGTWRVRAYVFKGADYSELTSDVHADKPLYAELDLPAIASSGDDITACVNYYTRQPAELVVATPFGEIQIQVTGSGRQQFGIQGPGRVEARIESQAGSDWTIRDIAPPGMQKVTASSLSILDRGQTVRGEKVVIYASMGQVLKDTITALIGYPFG